MLGLRIAVAFAAAAVLVVCSLGFARSSLNGEIYALTSLVLLAAAPNMRWLTLAVRGERAIAVGNALGQLVIVGLLFLLVQNENNILRVPVIVAVGELTFTLAAAPKKKEGE